MLSVSAIMPTKGREQWAAQALDCFMAQTHPAKELIILDDAADRSFKNTRGFPSNVRYYLDERPARNIPAKRNVCCGLSSAPVIMHWDSDDWSAPNRMADQVEYLELSGRNVTGYNSMPFAECVEGALPTRAFYYTCPIKEYAVGTSLAYFRSWWAGHKFIETAPTGEDNSFVFQAINAKQIFCVPCHKIMVARIHSGNTAGKDLKASQYAPMALAELPEGFY